MSNFTSKINSGAEELFKQYETHINKHDFNAVEELISDHAIFWFSSGTFRGKPEIKAAFEKTWSLIQNEFYWLSDVEWLTSNEESAACVYTFHWKGVIGGLEKEGLGRGTSILRNENKKWKIIHEHLSNFPK